MVVLEGYCSYSNLCIPGEPEADPAGGRLGRRAVVSVLHVSADEGLPAARDLQGAVQVR